MCALWSRCCFALLPQGARPRPQRAGSCIFIVYFDYLLFRFVSLYQYISRCPRNVCEE